MQAVIRAALRTAPILVCYIAAVTAVVCAVALGIAVACLVLTCLAVPCVVIVANRFHHIYELRRTSP